MKSEFNEDMLKPLVNKTFTLTPTESDNGDPIQVKLIELEKSKLDPEKWEAFTAVFENEGKEVEWTECQYRVQCEDKVDTTLFASPNSANEIEIVCSYQKD